MKESKVEISIIVPVYNVEQYLRRCLESLVNQTMQEIEIILVNDASPDHSDEIMREYAIQYPDKVKCIFLEKNKHQGGARNEGMKIAQGKYIMFVDSDDYIALDFCEKTYYVAQTEQCDVVAADYLVFYDSGRIGRRFSTMPDQCLGYIDEDKARNIFFVGHYPFAKLFLKSLFINHKITYPENLFYEDISCIKLALYYAKKISKTKETLYYYYQRENSVMHVENSSSMFDEARGALVYRRECVDRGIYMKYPEEVEAAFFILFYIYPLQNCIRKFKQLPKEYFDFLRMTIQSYKYDYYSNYYVENWCSEGQIKMAQFNDMGFEVIESRRNLVEAELEKYEAYYKRYRKIIRELLEGEKRKNRIIAVWGCGKKGQALLDALGSYQSKINFLIDKNVEKAKLKMKSSIPIHTYSDVCEEIDTVIVVNSNFFCEIEQEVIKKSPDKTIIDLEEHIWLKIVSQRKSKLKREIIQ